MAEKTVKKTTARKSTVSADKNYQLLVKKSKLAIAAENDETVCLAAPAAQEVQEWNLVAVGDCYKIACRQNGRVLDVILAGTENGAQIHLWEFTGADNQLWTLEPAGSGYYKIKSKSSGKVLDIAGMAAVEGARVQIWDDVDGDNQKWKLQEVKPAAKKTAAKKAPAAKTTKAAAAKKPAAKATAEKAKATKTTVKKTEKTEK